MSSFLADERLLQPLALINGHFVSSDSGETYPVHNPSTGALIAEVASCGASETRRAIEAADAAFKAWSRKTAKERSALLLAWRDELIAHKSDLARILSTEQGKPLAEAEGEILYGASYVQWFAEEAKRVYGDIIPATANNARLLTIKQPVGVVACITPWNFPNAMLARKIAPALAAGCTVVCKPANETPLSALALGELALRAGIPAGAINIISGRTVEIGAELTSNTAVRKLTFTGSTAVGKKLTADCAGTMKRTSMELGGNAPFIVFETADLDAAVEGLMANKFRNAGQTCVCTNRVLVQDSVLGEFAEKLTLAVGAYKVGDGFDPDVQIGPLISSKAARKVSEMIADSVAKGATIKFAGDTGGAGDNFVAPTIIYGATSDMRVFKDEIFGPVVPLFAFETEEEAVALANGTPFGLAAYFYSQDISQVWRVSEQIEAGMVGVNDAGLSSEMIPFGGIKESGQGREGSKYGLDDYLEIKHIKMGGLSL
tara:strand:+ start:2652 stop:4115 length:1464 start_codon:yes stop_codon:yes gene_type:complete